MQPQAPHIHTRPQLEAHSAAARATLATDCAPVEILNVARDLRLEGESRPPTLNMARLFGH